MSANLGPPIRMTRRLWISGACAAGFTAVPLLARQQQTHAPPGAPPKTRGPLVFRDYDQEEIDAAYDQALWAPNQAEIAKRNAQKSATAVARLGAPRRLAYGPTASETLDLYKARRPTGPIQIYVHGGAWRAGSAAASAYFAEVFVDRGAHFIAVDFNNAIETHGNLTTLADQVRRAVAWIHANAASFGGDPNRLFLSGTSSGAHLAAVALTTDWPRDFHVPADVIKGGLCASGMYDLYPVSLSRRRAYITFTADVIERLSPQRHLDKLTAPVVVRTILPIEQRSSRKRGRRV